MNQKQRTLVLILALAAVGSLSARPARAVLGGPAGSVESDRQELAAVRLADTARPGYTVQELRTDAHLVREYLSPAGIVFGIAWNGLAHPDLSPLLGAYDGEYRQALKSVPRKPGRRSLQVKGQRVIVEKWGHMRNLQGRAYAPELIPPGVRADEIK